MKHERNRVVVWCLVLGIVFFGCSPVWESSKKKQTTETLEEFVARHEKEFNPSKYKVPLNLQKLSTKKDLTLDTYDIVFTPQTPETVAGFRVQLFLTQDIDQAIQLRDSLNTLLFEDWVYVAYDAPYYKVRVGDYTDRLSANKMVKYLVEMGWKDAWVVPDQIIIYPPRTPPKSGQLAAPDSLQVIPRDD